MKKLILCAVLFSASVSANAQGYKETFDSNSLEWTECAYKNGIGTAIIDKGVMTIKSKGEKKGLSAVLSATTGTAVKAGENTFFETHCYAPIDMMKPFEIQAKVNIKQLAILTIRHMPLQYSGFGFYTFGNQELVVDEVEFRQ